MGKIDSIEIWKKTRKTQWLKDMNPKTTSGNKIEGCRHLQEKQGYKITISTREVWEWKVHLKTKSPFYIGKWAEPIDDLNHMVMCRWKTTVRFMHWKYHLSALKYFSL